VAKIAGAIVVCVVAAFAVAFVATGAGSTQVKHVTHHLTPVPFADSAAGDISFAGAPAALKLPPPPKPVKHHKHATAATAPVSAPATTPNVAPVAPVAPVYSPPPKHKTSSGSGTGTTTVG